MKEITKAWLELMRESFCMGKREKANLLECKRRLERDEERRRKAKKMKRKWRRRRMSRRLHQPKEKKKAEGRATWIHSD